MKWLAVMLIAVVAIIGMVLTLQDQPQPPQKTDDNAPDDGTVSIEQQLARKKQELAQRERDLQVREERLRRAAERQPRARIATPETPGAPEGDRKAGLEALRAERERINGLKTQIHRSLELLTGADAPYALYIVASWWSSKHPDGELGNVVAPRLPVAKTLLDNYRRAQPAIRVVGAVTVDRVQLKGGGEIIGKITARSPQLIMLDPMGEAGDSGLRTLRVDETSLVDRLVISAEAANRETVRRLCGRLSDAVRSGERIEALSTWGILQREFPEVAEKAVDDALANAGLSDADGFMRESVAWAATACPRCCGGLKDIPCEACSGTGVVEVEAPCPRCTDVKCPRCGKSRRAFEKCPHCGDRSLYFCRTCNNVGKGERPGRLLCKVCHGKGTLGRSSYGPFTADTKCRTCGGSGWVDCPDCDGKGVHICPRCKNKQTVMVDEVCHVCEGERTLTCPLCRGKGLR